MNVAIHREPHQTGCLLAWLGFLAAMCILGGGFFLAGTLPSDVAFFLLVLAPSVVLTWKGSMFGVVGIVGCYVVYGAMMASKGDPALMFGVAAMIGATVFVTKPIWSKSKAATPAREPDVPATPGTARCSRCHTSNKGGAVFCKQCGTRIDGCPKCGAEIDKDSEFCSRCGERLKRRSERHGQAHP